MHKIQLLRYDDRRFARVSALAARKTQPLEDLLLFIGGLLIGFPLFVFIHRFHLLYRFLHTIIITIYKFPLKMIFPNYRACQLPATMHYIQDCCLILNYADNTSAILPQRHLIVKAFLQQTPQAEAVISEVEELFISPDFGL